METIGWCGVVVEYVGCWRRRMSVRMYVVSCRVILSIYIVFC